MMMVKYGYDIHKQKPASRGWFSDDGKKMWLNVRVYEGPSQRSERSVSHAEMRKANDDGVEH